MQLSPERSPGGIKQIPSVGGMMVVVENAFSHICPQSSICIHLDLVPAKAFIYELCHFHTHQNIRSCAVNGGIGGMRITLF